MLLLAYMDSCGWGRNLQLVSYLWCVLLHVVQITMDPYFTRAPMQGQICGSIKSRTMDPSMAKPRFLPRDQRNCLHYMCAIISIHEIQKCFKHELIILQLKEKYNNNNNNCLKSNIQ